MKVLNFVRPENGLIHDPIYYLGFEKYENIAIDCYLFMADYYNELFSSKFRDKLRIVLTLEEPNFCMGEHIKIDGHADKILTLCPYTAKLFSNREAVFFPFNEEFIPPFQEKKKDIIYTGSIPSSIGWPSFLEIIKKYNYCDIHYNRGTNRNCSYKEKINLYAESKIALVHCLCSVQSRFIKDYRLFPKAPENEAFSRLEQGLMPQIKSRVFEAAFCKSLILCWKDPWRIIEKFFEPEKEFLYFENASDLDLKIKDILSNYSDYLPIIESAYIRAINNYTTQHFVKKFIGFK